MKKIVGAGFAGLALCLALNVFALPASAQSDLPADTQTAAPAPAPKAVKHKRVRHSRHRKHIKSKKTTNARAHIRTAQVYLDRLGYGSGAPDGIIGRKTKAALKAFQRDHDLPATGTLTTQTYNLLVKEAGSREITASESVSSRSDSFFAAHPDFYGYYGRDYANPTMLGSPQTIPSRFGNIQISDQANGSMHAYTVTLNGQTVFQADNQPSVINASRTFNLDGADAILFTSYANGDGTCPYRHYLLVVRANSNGLHAVNNCTRSYEAYTEQGSLYILFPEGHANAWSSGDMWRYESGSLAKL